MIEELTKLINACDPKDIAIIRTGKNTYFLRVKDYDFFENDPRLYANPEAVINLLRWFDKNRKYRASPGGYEFCGFVIFLNYESDYVS